MNLKGKPAYLTAKAFRRRVLKPVEGVFLFHPRAFERLIQHHLQSDELYRSIPPLSYYLMPRDIFLVGLEDENPDALSVIEGLSLPDQVILLPMPLARELATAEPGRLLRTYWARRFEAEVVRAWQLARDDNQDSPLFGAQGLCRIIGEGAFQELRDLLERDKQVIVGLDDERLCCRFVGVIVRLRYFSRGIRAYAFPAIRDWQVIDKWLEEGGLDLPPPASSSRLPQLLVKSRPSGVLRTPHYEPALPIRLPYGQRDPDLLCRASQITPLLDGPPKTEWRGLGEVEPTATCTSTLARISSPLAQRCQRVLQQSLAITRQKGKLSAFLHHPRQLLARLFTLLATRVANRLLRGTRWRCLERLALELRLQFIRHTVRAAQQAELASRYGLSLRHLLTVANQYRQWLPAEERADDPSIALLERRQQEVAEALTEGLAVTWKRDRQTARVLGQLITRLYSDPDLSRFSSVRDGLLDDLDAALLEGRVSYLRLQPLRWLLSGGRQPLRLILPFQGTLKALRALKTARSRLDRLPWSGREVDYYVTPLKGIAAGISARLRRQLTPRLQRALDGVGLTPVSHRERVACLKLHEELLDVLEQRWHLRFPDLRDAVARNDLRLPDLSLRELREGDRLTHLDRQAAMALPGVYRRGEFYLQGLQQLSAPLFGTRPGRFITRLFLLPFGAALIGLEALGYLLGLLSGGHGELDLVNPGSVLGVGASLGVILYTPHGRQAVRAFGRALLWLFTFILYRALWSLIQWGPVAKLLHHPVTRNLSRYLLEPLFIGLVTVLPPLTLLSINGLLGGGLTGALLALGFVLGNFLRNTQPGRRLGDTIAMQFINLWHQFRYTLITGLIRWLLDFFSRLMDGLEQGLHRVDELVSHRLEDGWGVMATKAVARPLWGALSYLTQFYATVLIEPQINPVKHFPVVTVSHKLMLPFLPVLTTFLLTLLNPVLPQLVSLPLVTMTLLLLPGLFGFLVWELKENWKLYSANHPERLQPVVVGHHGETLRTLLRRGFHSGTLPKAFAKVRQVLARESAYECSMERPLRQSEARLVETIECLQRFVQRELVASLRERCRASDCSLTQVRAEGLQVATTSFEAHVALYPVVEGEAVEPIRLILSYSLTPQGELHGDVMLEGRLEYLNAQEMNLLSDEVSSFLERSGAYYRREAVEQVFLVEHEADSKILYSKAT